jgi:drug/metabolite transporter (DMT)-like permease
LEGKIGVFFAFLCATGLSLTNVLIRKGSVHGDADNGMLITTLSNVAILSSAVAILGFGGYLSSWNTTGFLWFAGSGLLTAFLGRSMLFTSIGRIGSSRAAAIKNTAPMFTVAMAVFFLAERLSLVGIIGIGLACLGLLLLVYEAFHDPRNKREQSDEENETAEAVLEPETLDEDTGLASKLSGLSGVSTVIIGTLIAVLAALFFGLGQGIRKVGLEYMPDVFIGAMIASCAALVSYLVMSVLLGRASLVFRASFSNFRAYFWLAGLTTSIGQLAFFTAIMFAPVAHVSVIASSETLLTIFLAALFIGQTENISRRIIVAALFVFAGAAVIALS